MKKLITVGGQTYKLLIDEFEEDVDIDNLLKIDMSNLVGELITFPVIVNRFGILLADAESVVAEKKITCEVYEAKLRERLRAQWDAEEDGKLTEKALDALVIQDKGLGMFKKQHIEAIRQRDYVNSIFWSAKDKSNKLEKLSSTIQPGDIPDNVLEGRVNGILLKKTRKLIE